MDCSFQEFAKELSKKIELNFNPFEVVKKKKFLSFNTHTHTIHINALGESEVYCIVKFLIADIKFCNVVGGGKW